MSGEAPFTPPGAEGATEERELSKEEKIRTLKAEIQAFCESKGRKDFRDYLIHLQKEDDFLFQRKSQQELREKYEELNFIIKKVNTVLVLSGIDESLLMPFIPSSLIPAVGMTTEEERRQEERQNEVWDLTEYTIWPLAPKLCGRSVEEMKKMLEGDEDLKEDWDTLKAKIKEEALERMLEELKDMSTEDSFDFAWYPIKIKDLK